MLFWLGLRKSSSHCEIKDQTSPLSPEKHSGLDRWREFKFMGEAGDSGAACVPLGDAGNWTEICNRSMIKFSYANKVSPPELLCFAASNISCLTKLSCSSCLFKAEWTAGSISGQTHMGSFRINVVLLRKVLTRKSKLGSKHAINHMDDMLDCSLRT